MKAEEFLQTLDFRTLFKSQTAFSLDELTWIQEKINIDSKSRQQQSLDTLVYFDVL